MSMKLPVLALAPASVLACAWATGVARMQEAAQAKTAPKRRALWIMGWCLSVCGCYVASGVAVCLRSITQRFHCIDRGF
ncbi:hypothetical protein ACNRD9_00020, partial [Ralstonia pseudosolanacearum]|uniref:hypothetical protein n=1 Tax=Ralstonia pseudosolanacearum TaxID=1310165 RepID=UPI003AAE0EE8